MANTRALPCNKARSSTYIIKEVEKLVLCVYGVIVHSGNVERILEKPVKHSATLYRIFSPLIPSFQSKSSEKMPKFCPQYSNIISNSVIRLHSIETTHAQMSCPSKDLLDYLLIKIYSHYSKESFSFIKIYTDNNTYIYFANYIRILLLLILILY